MKIEIKEQKLDTIYLIRLISSIKAILYSLDKEPHVKLELDLCLQVVEQCHTLTD